jgi:PIN domain nuclease of toxin-antitoxin system
LILIDTHVLIWAVQEDARLGRKARQIIDDTTQRSRILVSAITPWEIAMLAEKARISLGEDVDRWLRTALALPGLEIAPLSASIAVDSVRLPGEFHDDPPDRIIVATARFHRIPLMTADQAILSYAALGHVNAIGAS